MKIHEVIDVLDNIITYYPNYLKMEDLEKTAKAWYEFLEEMDRMQVMINLREHVKTNKFPPTIADLMAFDKVENGRRAIPNAEETKLLLAAPFENKEVATEEERQAGLAAIREVVYGGDKL